MRKEHNMDNKYDDILQYMRLGDELVDETYDISNADKLTITFRGSGDPKDYHMIMSVEFGNMKIGTNDLGSVLVMNNEENSNEEE